MDGILPLAAHTFPGQQGLPNGRSTRSIPHPEGVTERSPGSRVRERTLGNKSPIHHEPQRGYPIGATRAPFISVTPLGFKPFLCIAYPGCARSVRPWALLGDPFGVAFCSIPHISLVNFHTIRLAHWPAFTASLLTSQRQTIPAPGPRSRELPSESAPTGLRPPDRRTRSASQAGSQTDRSRRSGE